MEQTDGWLTVLEKNGLGPAAAILENYGIDSETDLSVIDQDDFSKLASRGLKPLHVKKLERWCEAVRERAENMLPNTPAAAALLSMARQRLCTSAPPRRARRRGSRVPHDRRQPRAHGQGRKPLPHLLPAPQEEEEGEGHAQEERRRRGRRLLQAAAWRM